MAKQLIEVLIAGGRVVGQAFAKSFRQELEMSRQAAARHGGGRHGEKKAATDIAYGMSLQEAKEILNVTDLSDKEAVVKNYEHLFAVNDKVKGGSFYVQSKVVRANERIDKELETVDSTQTDSIRQQSIRENLAVCCFFVFCDYFVDDSVDEAFA